MRQPGCLTSQVSTALAGNSWRPAPALTVGAKPVIVIVLVA